MAKKSAIAFIVNFKDLADKQKNPKFSLSVREILNNPKIPKKEIKQKREV